MTKNMSPEVVYEPQQLLSAESSAQGNSTTTLISLVLVKMLLFIFESSMDGNINKKSVNYGVESNKNSDELNSQRRNKYSGNPITIQTE